MKLPFELAEALSFPGVALVPRLSTLGGALLATFGRRSAIFTGVPASFSGRRRRRGDFLRFGRHKLDGLAARVVVKLFNGPPEILGLFGLLHDERDDPAVFDAVGHDQENVFLAHRRQDRAIARVAVLQENVQRLFVARGPAAASPSATPVSSSSSPGAAVLVNLALAQDELHAAVTATLLFADLGPNDEAGSTEVVHDPLERVGLLTGTAGIAHGLHVRLGLDAEVVVQREFVAVEHFRPREAVGQHPLLAPGFHRGTYRPAGIDQPGDKEWDLGIYFKKSAMVDKNVEM